jgi:hypothetical protein
MLSGNCFSLTQRLMKNSNLAILIVKALCLHQLQQGLKGSAVHTMDVGRDSLDPTTCNDTILIIKEVIIHAHDAIYILSGLIF